MQINASLEQGALNAVITVPGARPKIKVSFDIILNTVPEQCDWSVYLRLFKSQGTLTFVGVPPAEANAVLTA